MDQFTLSKADKLSLIGSAILAIMAAITLAWPGLLQRFFVVDQGSGVVLGEVLSSTNDARRRGHGSFLWTDVFQRTSIYANDSLFTGPKSEMKVTLLNHMNVNLNPNSLVFLDTKEDKASIRLELGQASITLDRDQRVEVMHKGKVIELSADQNDTEVKLEMTGNGKLNLIPESKNVKIKGVGERSDTIGEGQLVLLDQKGIKRTGIAYDRPRYGEEMWIHPTDEIVNFEWRTRIEKPLVLQLAYDKGFQQIIIDQPVSKGKLGIKNFIKSDARLYWRVFEVEKKEQAYVSNFKVMIKKPPEPLYPIDIDVPINERVGEAEVNFRWNPVEEASQYYFELAKDKMFSQSIFSISTENEFVPEILLKRGEYFWRVKVIGEHAVKDLWSDSAQFTVKTESNVPQLAAADVESMNNSLLSLLDNGLVEEVPVPESTTGDSLGSMAKLDHLNFKEEVPKPDLEVGQPSILKKLTKTILNYRAERSPATGRMDVILNNPPQLEWGKGENANVYRLDIAKDEEFKNIVARTITKQKKVTWNKARPGKYFWRVRAIAGEKISEPSETGIIFNKLPTPKFADVKMKQHFEYKTLPNFKKSEPVVDVAWNSNPAAKGYSVEISRDKEFSQLYKKFKTTDNKLSFTPETNGEYFVRVAAEGVERELASLYSEPMAVDFAKSLVLDVPEQDSPLNNTQIVSLGSGGEVEPIIFSWRKIKGALEYELQLSPDRSFGSKVKTIKIKNPSYLLDRADRGITYWRVRSTAEEYRSKWSPARQFVVQ